jgi:protein gp37
MILGYTYNRWWGCTKKDQTCLNCYAETWSSRFGRAAWGPKADRVILSDQTRHAPHRWQREAAQAGEVRLVFCGSMMDVLEPRSDLDAEREALWELIGETPNLIWLLLTKRPEQCLLLLPPEWVYCGQWPPNVWMGTSAGTQDGLALRWPFLADVPAPVHFLSLEPLIAPVSFHGMQPLAPAHVQRLLRAEYDADQAAEHAAYYQELLCAQRRGPPHDPAKIWMIVGGESGPHARPMHPAWVRTLHDEAHASGMPFFFKQWGEWLPDSQCQRISPRHANARFGTLGSDGQWRPDEYSALFPMPDPECVYALGKQAAGRMLDGQIHHDHPAALYAYERTLARKNQGSVLQSSHSDSADAGGS